MPDFSGAAPLGGIGRPQPMPGQQQPAEPGFATPALQAQWEQLKVLRESNAEVMRTLAREHQTGVDPLSMLITRISCLIGLLFPEETEQGQSLQLELERRYETAIGDTLKEILKNITMARIAQGGQLSPQTIEKMARAAGVADLPPGFKLR